MTNNNNATMVLYIIQIGTRNGWEWDS